MKYFLKILFILTLCLLTPALAEETLTLPADLTHIGAEAFAGDASISEVIVPEGVLTIGSRAFADSGLTEITLPESLTEIADDAFEGCENVTATVTENSYAHEWCKTNLSDYRLALDYLYTLRDDAVVITAYTGADADVTIPETIDGMPVEEIAARAFLDNTGLVSVNVPDSVTSIGYRTFEGCVNLASIRMPEALTSIGGECFNGCASLTEIFIPDKVQFIGNGAFDGCDSLTAVYAEAGQNGATVISLCGLPFIDERDAALRLFQYTTDTGVLSLGAAQYLGNAAEYTLPESIGGVPVTGIEAGAFEGCEAPTKVTLCEGLLTIGSRAFADSGLKEIILPTTLTSIADDAFEGCENITAIIDAGSYANDWCFSSSNVSPIHACTIDDFYHTAENGEVCIVSYSGSATNLVVPETLRGLPVTSIGEEAFSDCKELVSITLPDSIASIGENAFINCKKLTGIELPDSLTLLGSGAFYKCSSLTSMAIPKSITSVPSYCFYYCTSLSSVELHNGITQLGSCAFDSTALTKIDLPDSLETIGADVFRGCTGLTEVVIPETVTTIYAEAFKGCTSLASINLPDGLTTLGNSAFRDCTSLTSIRIPGGLHWLQYDIFRDCTSLAEVTIEAGPTQIMSSCFRGCTALISVVVPEGVTTLDDYAFAYCTNLTSVTLPESLRTFGVSLFDHCDSVTVYVIEGSKAHEWAKYDSVNYEVI